MVLIDTLFIIAVIIFSVIIHEVMHGVAADSLGDPTARYAGRLTLNPLPHLDLFGSIILPIIFALTPGSFLFGWAKPVPYNPYNLKSHRWGETLVAGAGSATNLLLAVIFGLIARFGSGILSESALWFAASICLINLFLGLFNLIPFPPLDGFTVIRSALPWHLSSGLVRLENKIRMAGAFSLILFLIAFYYVLSVPFSFLVFWLFGLITGTGI